MILDDGAGTRLELHILGYQFPDLANHDYDSNWLVIQLRLDTPTDSWTRSAPCALTAEMEHLAAWLRQLAAGRDQPDAVEFMEPELEFRCERTASGSPIVLVCLSYSFRPDCSGPLDDVYFKPVALPFTPSAAELLGAAESIEAELRRFPPR